MERGTLHWIQFSRFVASMLVVLYHAGRMLPVYMPGVPKAFGFGHSGVDFFFVLSGFIITHAHGSDIGRPGRLGRYLWRRVTRIYPIYWLTTAAVLAAALLLGHADTAGPIAHLVQSVLLIPHRRDPILGVAWTLTHEMLFYLAFATLILDARIGTALFVGWGLLMLAALVRPLPSWGVAYAAQSWHLEFFLGMAAAWWVGRGRALSPRAPLLAGLAGFGVLAALESTGGLGDAGGQAHLAYGVASASIVVGLACAERKRPLAGRFAQATRALGAWSYALYLVHTMVIGYLAHALFVLGVLRFLPGAVTMSLCAMAAVAAAAIIHHWIERPMGRWLQGRVPARRAVPA